MGSPCDEPVGFSSHDGTPPERSSYRDGYFGFRVTNMVPFILDKAIDNRHTDEERQEYLVHCFALVNRGVREGVVIHSREIDGGTTFTPNLLPE